MKVDSNKREEDSQSSEIKASTEKKENIDSTINDQKPYTSTFDEFASQIDEIILGSTVRRNSDTRKKF